MNGKNRKDIKPGLRVNITQKQDQRSGRLTSGVALSEGVSELWICSSLTEEETHQAE